MNDPVALIGHALLTGRAPDTHTQVLIALGGVRLPLEREIVTQEAIGQALTQAGLRIRREQRVTGGIIDMIVESDAPDVVGLEVKLKGQALAIYRQLRGYAAEPALTSLILATAKPCALPTIVDGKRLSIVNLGRAWL